jgi:hypothetical protein
MTEEEAADRYYKKLRAIDRSNTRYERINALLLRIKAALPELEDALFELEESEEDGVYRYYHGSYKVFELLQDPVKEAFELIKKIGGEDDPPLDEYVKIVEAGTAHSFRIETNENWAAETRPILEAFWHTKYFVSNMVKYGKKLEKVEMPLDYGMAAVLYLYELR